MKTAILATLAALAAGTWAFAQSGEGPMMGPGRDGDRPWASGCRGATGAT